MALVDTVWYCNFGNGTSTGYYAVTVRPQNAAVAAGVLRRQFTAPAVGSERVFVCIIAGTTGNVTDATWVLTRGAKTVDGTATWMECTGQPAVNGDLTNTATWAQVKATVSAVLGQIIKRSNNASYQICTTAGAMSASEPAFSDTAGVTTTDTTAVWTSLGPVGNFTGGSAPHARLANVCTSTWFAAGNTCYVGGNHAEAQTTAINITPLLTQATMGKIVCHNQAGSYPPAAADLRTTATISTTGAAQLTFNPTNGAIYVYGLTFIGGVGQSSFGCGITLNPAPAFYFFDSCVFKTATTSASQTFVLNATTAGFVVWTNCQISFANAAQYIDVGNTNFVWQNTGTVLASGSTVPTNLIAQSGNGRQSDIILEALDLSQVTSVFLAAVNSVGNWVIKDCKLNASVTLPNPANSGQTIQLVRSDSGATAYKSARYSYEGTETTETSITRVGGSVDPAGQAQTRKIATTANAQWSRPFRAEPYAIWNSVTGANVTVTIYGTINAAAVPNNDDIWMTLVYLGSSLTPTGTFARTNKANILTAGTPVSTDNSVWNGGGSGAGWSPFKLTLTLSSPQPAMAGYIYARIRAAKPTTTFYIDPKVVLS